MADGGTGGEGDVAVPDLGTVPSPITLDGAGPIKVDIPTTRFLLDDLEKDAAKLADSISHVSGSLTANLNALTMIASRYSEVHKMAVDDVGKSVDHSIDAMSSLMIGCEQISENMPPIEKLIEQLKTVKDTLTILEDAVDATDMP
mmetsp:Transcript_16748/g.43468  ORF Transcript_16748/g.43468 Transcript_16748/m.43468 type:complete len:145 (+) Transcript_16748:46-480(+)